VNDEMILNALSPQNLEKYETKLEEIEKENLKDTQKKKTHKILYILCDKIRHKNARKIIKKA